MRPTGDRVRESIFDLLMHGDFSGRTLIGHAVADLCCGTGALGLEALSRGAQQAVFVDNSRESLALAKRNAALCGVLEQCHWLAGDVSRLPPAPWAVRTVFADPPYSEALVSQMAAGLIDGGWLQPETLLVLERPAAEAAPELAGFTLRQNRTYGRAAIRIYQKR